jgi:SET domain-containing protein
MRRSGQWGVGGSPFRELEGAAERSGRWAVGKAFDLGMKNNLSKKKLVIKRSRLPGAGKGLFTTVPIARGTCIVEYKGKITNWKEADHLNGRNRYLFYVNKDHVIDARRNKRLLARYANDAKGPRKEKGLLNNSTYEVDGDKVFIKAMKNIPADAEILVGYGKEYWDVIGKPAK